MSSDRPEWAEVAAWADGLLEVPHPHHGHLRQAIDAARHALSIHPAEADARADELDCAITDAMAHLHDARDAIHHHRQESTR